MMPGKVVSIHEARRRAAALRKARAVKVKRRQGPVQWVRSVWEREFPARVVFFAGLLVGALIGGLVVWSYVSPV